jgi:hypothetical protein
MNQTPDPPEELKRFTVVMRGPAALVFQQDRSFGYDDYPTPLGAVQVSYRSRWPMSPVRMPGHLWVEINGAGPNFETVVPVLANAGLSGLPVMSLACNVAIQDPQIEIAFESTPGATRREFLQAYVRPESGVLSAARIAPPDAIAVVQTAVARSEYRDALLRACDQYRLALDSWAFGRESLTLAHLWMAVEAITKVQRNELMRAYAVESNQALADKLNISKQDLDPTVRREYLLAGDVDCYKKAKDASDGFEHGHLGFDVIRTAAAEVRERLARYVRHAIFRLAKVPQSTVDVLGTDPFDKPLGIWPLVKFFTGTLVGSGSELGTSEHTYPVVLWAHQLKSVAFDANGKMQVQFQDRMQPQLPPGITLEGGTYQIWDGGSGIQLNAPLDPNKRHDPVVIEAPPQPVTLGNAVFAIDDPVCAKWTQPLGSFLLNCNAMRYFALHWTQSLGGPHEFMRRPTSFRTSVRRIRWFLWRKRVPKELRARCRVAWYVALQLEETSRMLSGGVTVPEGLALIDYRHGGQAPMASTVEKLIETNKKVIANVADLRALLAEIQALPLFKSKLPTH